MRTEIINNTYDNGHRICVQRVIYNKSDDLYMLAELQYKLEALSAQYGTQMPNEIAEEIEKLTSMIAAQEILVNGYNQKDVTV